MNPRAELIRDILKAIEGGASSSQDVARELGCHFSTVTRHLRLANFPPVSDIAAMSAAKRAKLKDKIPEDEKPKGREIPTADKRPGYATRKEFGSRAVICRHCKRRGTANVRIVGRRGSVTCGDCKRAGLE